MASIGNDLDGQAVHDGCIEAHRSRGRICVEDCTVRIEPMNTAEAGPRYGLAWPIPDLGGRHARAYYTALLYQGAQSIHGYSEPSQPPY
jgi:hypothetical protein